MSNMIGKRVIFGEDAPSFGVYYGTIVSKVESGWAKDRYQVQWDRKNESSIFGDSYMVEGELLPHIVQPRKQKMSDTKLYKSLKRKMPPEKFKVVYNNLKPIWKTWTTDKDSSLFSASFKGFDTPYIWAAFSWHDTPQGDNYWYNVAFNIDNM